ncbi:UNVERIFIED_CONTAM: hypothetical protein FKN15_014966 [Acipenser sinensis]
MAALSFLFVFLQPAESERGVWRQKKPWCSERERDEVIQVVVESPQERPQLLTESPGPPEGKYHTPQGGSILCCQRQSPRESPASPECPALLPEKENPVPQLPPESSAPQLPSERECPAPPKRKCPTLPARARRGAASAQRHQ